MVLRSLAFLLLAPAIAAAQNPPIGIIDFYGLHKVSEAELRRALPVHEGDSFPESPAALIRSLKGVAGVRNVSVNSVCCEDLKSILYIGIEESASAAPPFRADPRGSDRLPVDMIGAGEGFQAALSAAVARGDFAEDDSRGHTLVHDSVAREFQERYVIFAARDLPLLRRVLKNSADPGHRALAAQIIAYASDKRAVVPDLLEAVRDPSEAVRNNAMRALGVMAGYAEKHPEKHIRISPEPFIDLLNSPVWTDRNKASLALAQLVEPKDPSLLRDLRARALPSMLEMVRWKARGHAGSAFLILGRIGGMSEEALHQAWASWDTTAVIDAATAGH